MQLMRLGQPGHEKPAVRVDDDHYVDVSDVVGDHNAEFFAQGHTELQDLVTRRTDSSQVRQFDGVRVGAPITRPHQILCIGLNYTDHAAETGLDVPDEPILFTSRPTRSLGRMTTCGSPVVVRKPTGRWSSASSCRGGRVTWTALNTPVTTSPATSS